VLDFYRFTIYFNIQHYVFLPSLQLFTVNHALAVLNVVFKLRPEMLNKT